MSEHSPRSRELSARPPVADQLQFVRRNWLVVVLSILVAAATAYWLTERQEPVYRASSEVLLRTDYNVSLFPLGSSGQDELLRFPEIEALYVGEAAFRQTIRDLQPPGVAVTPRADASSGSLEFVATGASPQGVALAADLWAETYLEERRADLLAQNQASIDFVEERLIELNQERDTLRRDLTSLERRLAAAADNDEFSQLLNQKLILEEQLQPDLDPLQAQISRLNEEVASLELAGRMLDSTGVAARLNRPATVPTVPVSPDPVRNVGFAAVVGLVLGAALAYAREALSAGSVSGADDFASSLGLAPLAVVPRFKIRNDGLSGVLATPTSPAGESYRSLLTALELVARSTPFRSLLVTSPNAKDGKSTTAINLAALASVHADVLLVGADLRRPTLEAMIGDATDRPGLADVLSGSTELDDAVVRVEHERGSFDLLPSGPAVADPTPILRGDGWASLLEKLQGRYGVVLIDAPPVLPVTDALLLAREADAMIVVAASGTDDSDLTDAVVRLESTGTPLLGGVLNKDRSRPSRSYRYDYSARG